jgi:hypothetical protein
MLNSSTQVTFLLFLLLCGASVHADDVESDSTRTARPSFSMTPT